MKKLYLLLFGLSVYSCSCTNGNKLPVEQMQTDIDFFFTTLKEVHPYLYYKHTEIQIDSVWKAIKDKCEKPLTTSQFRDAIAQANKYLDNHSQIWQEKTGEISGYHTLKSNYDSLNHSRPYAQHVYEEDSIGVFYFNTSAFYEAGDKIDTLKKQLDSITMDFFWKVKSKDIKHVFIDVSQNSGGSSQANTYLIKYLNYKPHTVHYTSYVRPKGAEIFAKQTEHIPGLEDARKNMFKIAENGQMEYAENINGNNGFKGNVYIIMGRGTVSAAFSFCESIKLAQAGILAGETPSQYSPYAGNTLFFDLPHSGLKFSCGSKLVKVDPDVTNGAGFLKPDIPYKLDHPLTLNDYKEIIKLSGKDM